MPRSSPRLKAATTTTTNDNDDDEPTASTPPLKDDIDDEAVSSSKKKAVKKVKGAKKATTAKKGATKRKKAASNDEDDDILSDTEDSTVSSSSSSKASPKKKTKKAKGTKKATTKTKKQDKEDVTMDEANSESSDSEAEDEEAPKKTKKKRATKKRKTTKKKATTKSDNDAEASGDASGSDSDGDDDDDSSTTSKTKKKKTTKTKRKKKAKAPVQSITDRDELPKLWSDEKAKANGSYTLRIATWNVAGLRAILKKDPEALAKLVTEHQIDILCLQETKLQEMHLDDPKLQLRGHLLEAEGYDAYYSCSVERKGYAGTAVFVKRRGTDKAAVAGEEDNKDKKKKQQQTDITSFFGKKEKKETDDSRKADDKEGSSDETLPVDAKLLMPEKVSYGLGIEKHNAEGRVIVLDFPGFTMANLYVPNSGQKLDRLSYRTDEWDKDLVSYMQTKQTQRGKPVMWLGDLNVAHKEYEAYNFGAKHLDKQAGLTPQERASFTAQLEAGFVDAFRHLHPTAKGHYTYWSQRAGNREPNKGLRLDYFVCDPSFFDDKAKVVARDSYMIPDQMGSDHCPAVLELEIKP